MITIKVKPISFDDERTDTLTIDNEQEFWDFRHVKDICAIHYVHNLVR